ncbi:hypothetical protein PG997_007853 [Apiospora hydei]|uniref:Zn(2)-C6 fungal-type domain-containing protein n=1 Tax=Apiospora hydei TaxID=1337664 RepID=A0ABR1W964_9PEZI
MEAQTQVRPRAQAGVSSPQLLPPPPSFDEQRIYNAMNEEERHQLDAMTEGPDQLADGEQGPSWWDMLVFTSNLVHRLENESPEQLYAAGTPVPTQISTAGQQPPQSHGESTEPESPSSTSSESPPFDNRQRHTRTPLPGRRRGGNPRRSPTPSPFIAQAGPSAPIAAAASTDPAVPAAPEAPSPNTEAAPTQPPQPTAARLSKLSEKKKKRESTGDGGQSKERNTTENENMLAKKIKDEGIANPYGPCSKCVTTGGTCWVLVNGESMRCAKCARQKSRCCFPKQYEDNPDIINNLRSRAMEAEAAAAAAAEAAASQADTQSYLPHHQNPEGSTGPEIPNETNLDETNEFPG